MVEYSFLPVTHIFSMLSEIEDKDIWEFMDPGLLIFQRDFGKIFASFLPILAYGPGQEGVYC